MITQPVAPTISEQELAVIMQFVQKKYVHHYDLQLELADHIATAIEAKWMQNPQISFEDALREVYAGFGVMGFSTIVREKTSHLTAQHKKARLKLFGQFFRWPQALFTILLMAITYGLSRFLPIDWRSYFLLIFLVVIVVAEIYSAYYHSKCLRSLQHKLLWTDTSYRTVFTTFILLQGMLQFDRWIGLERKDISTWQFWLMTVLLIICSMSVYCFYQYTKQLFQIAKQRYPLAFKPQ